MSEAAEVSATTTSHTDRPRGHGLGEGEFIAMMSMTSATIAMSIDTLLPAFDEMREAFGMAPGDNAIAWTITALLLGLAAGQLFWGPIADRFGRKPAIYAGLAVLALGALGATLSGSFAMLITGRAVWGFGAAAPRAVTMAVIRDVYSGDRMARISSFVTAVFLIVPVLAPLLGEGLVRVGGWRATLAISIALSAVLAIWMIRLQETLEPENRRPLRPGPILAAGIEVLSHRVVLAYVIAQIMAYSAFFPWLGSSELMIGEIYDRPGQFAVLFSLNAVAMGVCIALAGRAVTTVGAPVMLRWVLAGWVVVAAVGVAVALRADGTPAFWVFFGFATALTVLNAMASPLLASLALAPMGHLAGTASALSGAVVFAAGALFARVVDGQISDTITPFLIGFLVFGLVALGATQLVHRRVSTDPSYR